MEEIVKQVAERTGISEAQAQTAVITVVGFLKSRLPESLAGHLDSFIGGGAAPAGGGGGIGDVLGGLGGMLGGNKE